MFPPAGTGKEAGMAENKETKAEAKEEIKTVIDYKKSSEELRERVKTELEEIREKNRIALEAMGEGKGRLQLETPIPYNDEEITELPYDFTTLTGMEYADAMDKDPGAQQIYRITYRQGLALFATAAAKQISELDVRDIMERLGITDAVEGVQLATSFFAASTRAGRLRITKR